LTTGAFNVVPFYTQGPRGLFCKQWNSFWLNALPDMTNIQTCHNDLCSGWQYDNTMCTVK